MQYKKILLSLVATLAINNMVSADTVAKYLPLSTAANDGSWVLFGINGFSNGVSSAAAGQASAGFTPGYEQLEDTVLNDLLAEAGIVNGGPVTDTMMSLQGLVAGGFSSLIIAVDSSAHTFLDTEPVRTMFITDAVNGAPKIKLSYKASFEGDRLELIYNNDMTLRTVTISQENTWDKPAVLEIATPLTVTTTYPPLTAIVDVVDVNLKNNPGVASDYNATNDRQAVSTAAAAAFYHFDALTQEWKVWNKQAVGVVGANDYTDFSAGSAYWGRIDFNDNPVAIGNASTNPAGLVVGKATGTTGASDAAKYAGKLALGWNMLSFNDYDADIRYSATGLVVTKGAIATGSACHFKIYDDTGVHSILLTASDTVFTGAIAKNLNAQIESAKLRGLMPSTFNVKIFLDSNANLVFISDKKFSLVDTSDATVANGATDDAFSVVKTLTGDNPYVLGLRTAVPLLTNLIKAESAYGEYALMLNLMVNDLATNGGVAVETASNLDALGAGTGTNYSAKILFGNATTDTDGTPLGLNTLADILPTGATAVTAIETDTVNGIFDTAAFATIGGRGLLIDSDFNGASDKVIMASKTPFYVKDNTFTRAFTYTDALADGTAKITVNGGTEGSVVVANDASMITADLIADNFRDIADTSSTGTNVYAGAAVGGNQLVFVSTNDLINVYDAESGTIDFLTEATPNTPLGYGAVKEVYSLSKVARQPLGQYSFAGKYSVATKLPIGDGATPATDDTFVATVAGFASVATTVAVDAQNVMADRITLFNQIVSVINGVITANNLHGYATHSYVYNPTTLTDNILTAEITVHGLSTSSISVVFTDVGVDNVTIGDPTFTASAANATAQTLGEIPSLIGDLKYNAVYAPNYADYGPLYTLKEAGYDVKAVLKATTDMTGTTMTGEHINWDAVDLTRAENDWFKDNVFNVFSVNQDVGYWVYLVPKTDTPLTVDSAVYNPDYTYYFDNTVGTTKVTKNNPKGNLVVSLSQQANNQVSGSNVFATVGSANSRVQLQSNGTQYTAQISKFANGLIAGSVVDIGVRATDGKGKVTKTADNFASFDYRTLPTPSVTFGNGTTATITGTTDVKKFHLFKDYIPENPNSRAAQLLTSTTPVGGVATYNICKDSTLAFGSVQNVRVVGVDGATGNLGTGNASDAKEFIYATTLKGAHVLSHTAGAPLQRDVYGISYDSNCTTTGTALTTADGEALKSLDGSIKLAYNPAAIPTSVTEGAPLIALYAASDAPAVPIAEIQNLTVHGGEFFFVQYNGKLYRGTFAPTAALATASYATPRVLDLQATVANPLLAP